MPCPPRYADLPRPDDSTLPLAWGVWGRQDQVGTLNNIVPDGVVAAARLVRRGIRFNLDLPLHVPLGLLGPGAHRLRSAPTRTLFTSRYASLDVRDDKVDGLFLQGSTQWDGLTHVGDPRRGFYNGVQDHEITQEEGTRNGIERFAEFGIAGRGVLVDLPRFFAGRGRSWSAVGGRVATADDLAAGLADQGVALRPGDVLLVRTGWLAAFLSASDPEVRERLFRGRDYSGLSGGEDMWAYLWDHRVAAVASDSVTVEAWPLRDGEPSLHLAIARLGLVLGEMFDLEALAADSAEQRGYECLFTSSPLNLRGGTGSPANAIAIR